MRFITCAAAGFFAITASNAPAFAEGQWRFEEFKAGSVSYEGDGGAPIPYAECESGDAVFLQLTGAEPWSGASFKAVMGNSGGKHRWTFKVDRAGDPKRASVTLKTKAYNAFVKDMIKGGNGLTLSVSCFTQ
jgi:hypothetical protein